MIRLATALTLMASPALADTVCSYGDPGTTVSIEPGHENFATIHIDNHLAHRLHTRCTLTLYGVSFQVEYDPGPGDIPDWFHVTTPPGFEAHPPSKLIDDWDTGEIQIIMTGGHGS